MGEILKFVAEKSGKYNENHEKLIKILDIEYCNIGLLINERLVNLSPKLTPVLHKQLCEDVSWIKTQKEPDSQYYNFKYLLGISKCFKDIKISEKKKFKGTPESDLKNYIYPKFEEYEFMAHADISFLFEANTSKNTSGITNLDKELTEQQCLRLVYLITWDKYISCVNNLENNLESLIGQ